LEKYFSQSIETIPKNGLSEFSKFALQFNTVVDLAGGCWLLILELGSDSVHPVNEGEFSDIVVQYVDEWVEKDVAVSCHHYDISSDVIQTATAWRDRFPLQHNNRLICSKILIQCKHG